MVDMRGHATLWPVGISGDLGAKLHGIDTGALHQRLIQQHMQLAPMRGVLRPAIACIGAARLCVNLLPLLPDQRPFPCGHADFVQLRLGQPQIKQLAHGIGLDVDPHTQGFQAAHLFIDGAAQAKLVQRKRQCKAADTAACDQDMGLGHSADPLSIRGHFVL